MSYVGLRKLEMPLLTKNPPLWYYLSAFKLVSFCTLQALNFFLYLFNSFSLACPAFIIFWQISWNFFQNSFLLTTTSTMLVIVSISPT